MGVLKQVAYTLGYPFIKLGSGYNNLALKWPRSTAVVTTTLKTTGADAFAQLVVEKNEVMDWKRNAVFTAFGFGYLGVWQYYLYNTLFRSWCKPITSVVGHWGSAPVKVFLDQAIHHPLLYFPTFYVLKGSIEGRHPIDSIKRSFVDLPENVKACWAVWVPAQLVNFSVVPHHLRIPFVALVSFLWTVIISGMRGRIEQVAPVPEEAIPPPMPDLRMPVAPSFASSVFATGSPTPTFSAAAAAGFVSAGPSAAAAAAGAAAPAK
ncbi:hypothetical protein FOA52_014914 [Chlamydomonas sp. UWO 241]|nr:hypothetical protein FOA52_014914 [Chlamydomonas sp. UWO 241]